MKIAELLEYVDQVDFTPTQADCEIAVRISLLLYERAWDVVYALARSCEGAISFEDATRAEPTFEWAFSNYDGDIQIIDFPLHYLWTDWRDTTPPERHNALQAARRWSRQEKETARQQEREIALRESRKRAREKTA